MTYNEANLSCSMLGKLDIDCHTRLMNAININYAARRKVLGEASSHTLTHAYNDAIQTSHSFCGNESDFTLKIFKDLDETSDRINRLANSLNEKMKQVVEPKELDSQEVTGAEKHSKYYRILGRSL
jgi:hypothetical protein